MFINKKEKRINLKIYICLFVCLFISNNLFSQEYKWIQIGALHGWFAENGSEKEVGASSSNQQRGLRWPAFFEEQDCQAYKALWIGAANFADFNGRTYDYKVVATGPRIWGYTQFLPVPDKFIMGTRFPEPYVYVDGDPRMDITNYVDDDPDPDLPADRVITNIVNTSMGIQMTRKIYAFSHQLHDNYFIYEYDFTNTGDCNNDGVQDLNNTLQGVYFYFANRYSPGREGCIFTSSVSSAQWGTNTLFESIGDEENSTSPFRAIFGMHGRHSGVTYDNTGGPSNNASSAAYSKGDGHLASAQYVGWCTIHADRSVTDKSDDRSQPRTVSYEDSDHNNMAGADGEEFDISKMGNRYAWMSSGWKRPRHNELVPEGAPVDRYAGGGGYSACIGYGPYTIPIGGSIKIVVAEAVAGLNRDECYRIGAEWMAGTCTFPGVTGNDAAKNAWVRTGRDSILQTFQRATDNWNSGFKMPQPPEPPTRFEVNSGGDRISLSWSNSSESDPTLKSYRLYRSDSSWDSRNYRLIAELPKGTLSYNDLTPTRGFSYYYYLQCVGDGSNNGGVELVSNRQLTQTYQPGYLMREGMDNMGDMAHIRVVPNPFNVRARDLQYRGERDKIMFLDIPGQCTIKIYTERGDLIKTINHTNGSGDERWDCITEYRQVVVSGLYIAHFETPDGRSTYRKFVVVR